MQEFKIGLRIRQRRKELGLTQDELAKRMGYKSRSTINKIEKGSNDVSQSNVVKFAEVLHTTIAYLMGWTENSDKDLDPLTPVIEKAKENFLLSIPTPYKIILNSIDDSLDSDNKDSQAITQQEIEEALELYKQYKKATPRDRSIVDSLLKSGESQP